MRVAHIPVDRESAQHPYRERKGEFLRTGASTPHILGRVSFHAAAGTKKLLGDGDSLIGGKREKTRPPVTEERVREEREPAQNQTGSIGNLSDEPPLHERGG